MFDLTEPSGAGSVQPAERPAESAPESGDRPSAARGGGRVVVRQARCALAGPPDDHRRRRRSSTAQRQGSVLAGFGYAAAPADTLRALRQRADDLMATMIGRRTVRVLPAMPTA